MAEEHSAHKPPGQKTMTLFDNDPSHPPEHDAPARLPDQLSPSEREVTPFAGDPLTYAPPAAAHSANPALPEDLRISWSWPHFIIFLFFTAASFVVVQTTLFGYYGPHQRLSKDELERYLLNKPQFIFGTNILWYASVLLFLYVTLSVLRELPFWSSLGWKKLHSSLPGNRGGPWVYFFCGCALAIFVALAGSQVHSKESMPIQELFKNRNNALLFMGTAVLIAPLVEETVFRGYLYPLFAKSFGIVPGVLLTGVLFGLMHGYQLGWTWGMVALLVLVGVIFTFARARTGTVLASFLLHLGYNSMIAVTTLVGTHGFTQFPTAH
jgi:membrane protease YdiL (CAAX protease family)